MREGDHDPEDRAQMLEKQDRLTELSQRFVIALNEAIKPEASAK